MRYVIYFDKYFFKILTINLIDLFLSIFCFFDLKTSAKNNTLYYVNTQYDCLVVY